MLSRSVNNNYCWSLSRTTT